MPLNFVSVSAVSDREQLEGIARICRAENFSLPLVIGYQVSSKSINQGTQNMRQPRFADLGVLHRQTRDYGFITAVHYYTKDNKTIEGDLERVAKLGVEPSETLLQFNTLPPSLELLRKVKKMGFKIILKAAVSDKESGGYAVWKGEGVEDVSRGEVAPLVQQVWYRGDFIDYVMFDPSHGTNLDLNLDENSLAVRFGKRVVAGKELAPFRLGLVYAGGINPKNVWQITKTLKSFFPGRFSIDAESGVRTNDEIDLELVRSYLVGYRNAMENLQE